MDLRVLFALIIYYSLLGLMLIFAGFSGLLVDVDSSSIDDSIDSSALTSDEQDMGGLFGTGVSFGRFALLITTGIGLPGGTPVWVSLLFGAWQSMVTLFSIGWLISSIWNG